VIIGLIVCAVAGLGGAIWGVSAVSEDDSATITVPVPDGAAAPAPDEAERWRVWNAWAPPLGSTAATTPTGRQADIAEQALGTLLPGFSIDEVVVSPGYYDESRDFHIADTYYYRAARGDTELASQFWATPEGWAEEGIYWDEDALGENRVLGTVADDIQYEYDASAFVPLYGRMLTEPFADLLRRARDDWYGGVCVWADYEGVDERRAWVYVTTWESYIDDLPFTGVEVVYAMDEDGYWSIESWSWYEE
jgi:hypothetical protein